MPDRAATGVPNNMAPALSPEDVQRAVSAEMQKLRTDMARWQTERAKLESEIEGLRQQLHHTQNRQAPARVAPPPGYVPSATARPQTSSFAAPSLPSQNNIGSDIRAPRSLLPDPGLSQGENRLSPPLRLPGADRGTAPRIRSVYLTQPGDSLDSIGRQFDVSPRRLRAVNTVPVSGNSHLLPTGFRIQIPE